MKKFLKNFKGKKVSKFKFREVKFEDRLGLEISYYNKNYELKIELKSIKVATIYKDGFPIAQIKANRGEIGDEDFAKTLANFIEVIV